MKALILTLSALILFMGACSNPTAPDGALVEVLMQVSGTAEECYFEYTVVTESIPQDQWEWVGTWIDEFMWTRTIYVENHALVIFKLYNTSNYGYFDLAVYVNGHFYATWTGDSCEYGYLEIEVEY